MKKYLFNLAVMVLGTRILTSCLGDDKKTDDPVEYIVTNGALIINNGSSYNGIDGSLTFLDYETGEAKQNVFKTANGTSLGGTPNALLVYGDKIYIAGSDENTVFVLNKKTF